MDSIGIALTALSGDDGVKGDLFLWASRLDKEGIGVGSIVF
jgi:hypothetical protein